MYVTDITTELEINALTGHERFMPKPDRKASVGEMLWVVTHLQICDVEEIVSMTRTFSNVVQLK